MPRGCILVSLYFYLLVKSFEICVSGCGEGSVSWLPLVKFYTRSREIFELCYSLSDIYYILQRYRNTVVTHLICWETWPELSRIPKTLVSFATDRLCLFPQLCCVKVLPFDYQVARKSQHFPPVTVNYLPIQISLFRYVDHLFPPREKFFIRDV